MNAAICNIYNAKDFALDLWIFNQKHFKPENLGYPIPREVGTLYTWDSTTGLGSLHYGNGFFHNPRLVIDPQESVSFIARSRTEAVGALATGGSIENNFDVGDNSSTGLSNNRQDHSGEFTRPIQQLYPFYRYLYCRIR